jgi:hypothetical protein
MFFHESRSGNVSKVPERLEGDFTQPGGRANVDYPLAELDSSLSPVSRFGKSSAEPKKDFYYIMELSGET